LQSLLPTRLLSTPLRQARLAFVGALGRCQAQKFAYKLTHILKALLVKNNVRTIFTPKKKTKKYPISDAQKLYYVGLRGVCN